LAADPVGTFTWRGKTTLIAIRVHQDGLLLQRLYFADVSITRPRSTQAPSPRSATRSGTLAERLISELSETEFNPRSTRMSTGSVS
jgi:non-homologous end joining protein Ku